jgi:hypothetical protein
MRAALRRTTMTTRDTNSVRTIPSHTRSPLRAVRPLADELRCSRQQRDACSRNGSGGDTSKHRPVFRKEHGAEYRSSQDADRKNPGQHRMFSHHTKCSTRRLVGFRRFHRTAVIVNLRWTQASELSAQCIESRESGSSTVWRLSTRRAPCFQAYPPAECDRIHPRRRRPARPCRSG